MRGCRRPGVRRRWPFALLAAAAALLAGAFVAAVFSERRLEGAVPGDAPLSSLGAVDAGFLAGTGEGLFTSTDGVRWSFDRRFGSERTLVASSGGAAVVSTGRVLARTGDLRTFDRRSDVPPGGTAIALAGDGVTVYLAAGSEGRARIFRLPPGAAAQLVPLQGEGPAEVVALAVGVDGGVVAGGLRSGLWTTGHEGRWRRLLATPARAVMIDPSDPSRILLGTPGGILVSRNGGREWRFTGFRSSVEGLATSGGKFYALAADRLIYVSPDGETGWAPIPKVSAGARAPARSPPEVRREPRPRSGPWVGRRPSSSE